MFRNIVFTLALFTASVFPYEIQYADAGRQNPLKWPGGRLEISVSTSLLEEAPNLKGSDAAFAAVLRSVDRWERVSGLSIKVSVSDLRSVSPPGKTGDGVSLVTIAQTPENLLMFSGANSRAAAFTRLFHDESGNITEADIVLNPFFLSSTDGTPGSFDLESTISHELGHAIGLGHSLVLGATMSAASARNGLYGMPFTLPRTLSDDDVTGARTLYGAPKGSTVCCAEVRGVLDGGSDGAGRFEVWVVDPSTGKTVASVSSDVGGRFRIAGLEPSDYQLYARNAGDGNAVFLVGKVKAGSGEALELGRVNVNPEGFGIAALGVGFNGELASVAVPINGGSSYRVYVSGKGPLSRADISVPSRFFRIDDGSFERIDFGKDLTALSFIIAVDPEASAGDYSLVVTDENGNTDWILGALTVERVRNPWPILEF